MKPRRDKNLKKTMASKHGIRKPKPQKKQKQQQQQRQDSASRFTIPFQQEDAILLVGEGDFSFSKSIIAEHGCCDVTATCLDSQTELYEKYDPQAKENVEYLEDEGQTVHYGVDATKLDENKALKKKGAQFDVVIFNFPHVGGKSKDVNRQVRFNQELLVKFFTAASKLLAAAGTIVVTLFEGEPYTLWNIRDLARHSGLEVQRSFKFLANAYPGYSHSRTLGNIIGGGGWKGEDREARSYVFQKKATGTTDKNKKPASRPQQKLPAQSIEQERQANAIHQDSDEDP
jgi:25S rRNA (uracil2634-N3)-methyltransferase